MENYPYPYDVRHHDNRGMAATGIGLGAGLGGAALLAALIGVWGVNKASEARSQGNLNALNTISQFALSERTSRENWQLAQTPTVRQYVDVQAGAGAGAYANALAYAQANGLNSAIGHESFLRVQRYSAPQPCGCDSCGS
jgi:hypothetical protein